MKKNIQIIAALYILAAANNSAHAQSWNLTGNAGTNASTNFIGTTDNVAFKIRTNNAVRMSINGSGKVGIGTTVPGEKLEVSGKLKLTNGFSTANAAIVYTNDADYLFLGPQSGSETNGAAITLTGATNAQTTAGSGSIGFHVPGVINAMVIEPVTGNVGIGTSTPSSKFTVVAAAPVSGIPVAFIENTGGTISSDGLHIKAGSNTNDGSYFIIFFRPSGSFLGGVKQNNVNGVSYVTTSDKRLKNIIGTSQKGLSDLMKIKIYDYTFKSDPAKKVQTGFMAQELYDIFPQSVSKPRDNNEPAEKNPWMVDYGSVTPLIIRSVQELDEIQNSKFKMKRLMN